MEEMGIKKQLPQPKEAEVAFQKKIDELCEEMELTLLKGSTPDRKEGMPLDAKNTRLIRQKFILPLRRCASNPNQPPPPQQCPSSSTRKKKKNTESTNTNNGDAATTVSGSITETADTAVDDWGAKYGDVVLTYFGWKMFNPKKKE